MKWLEAFQLTATERKGFTVLVGLCALLILVRIGLFFIPEKQPSVSQIEQEFEEWQSAQITAMRVSKSFDPNTVADSTIYLFKISPFAAKNWIAFRAKGRKFTNPRDVLAIYGMDSSWFEINKDSIKIVADLNTAVQPNTVKNFPFDPNTVTEKQMLALGFPEWLAKRIENYRGKGGTFRQAEDLKKIFGFPEDLYTKIAPFIQIAVPEQSPQPKQIETIASVEINSCDSLALVAIKGIGPTFAHRILEERKRLGGFYSTNQLLSIYGITQERLASFKDVLIVNQDSIVQLNINEASFKTLLAHPYLSYKQVQQIVNFRESIRPFKDISELLQISHFTEEDLNRLKYYLKVR